MTNMDVNSVTDFESRVVELGMSEHLGALRKVKWNTQAGFAYAVTAQPGGTVDAALFEKRVSKYVFQYGIAEPGEWEDPPESSQLLRLWHE